MSDFFAQKVRNVPMGKKFAEVIEALDETGRAQIDDVCEELGTDFFELNMYRKEILSPSEKQLEILSNQYRVNVAYILTNDDCQPMLF